jgi:hypothetical protein
MTDARIVAHFDIDKGHESENIVLEPDGSADLTWVHAAQVANVSLGGEITIIAEFPDGLVSGIARAEDGTLYVLHNHGSDQDGVYRFRRGDKPELFAPLPGVIAPNGVTIEGDTLYLADSTAGIVWRIHDGVATEWLNLPILAPNSPRGYGVNGVKVHDGAVWLSQTDKGLLLRVPFTADGSAGPVETKVTGLAGIDDFAFTGRGDEFIAAMIFSNTVLLVRADGSRVELLTEQDGLSNPTSVAISGETVYVPSAAYLTRRDPNLLVASWRG